MNFQPSSPAEPSALRRQLDAFVALPDRIRLPAAILLALLVHALIVLASVIMPELPKSKASAEDQTARNQPLEIILATPTPAPQVKLTAVEETALEQKFAELPPEIQREYVDVDGLAAKKNMSKRALLESWQDSVAGTRKQGKENAPSQDGREDLIFTNFKNQRANPADPKNPPMVAANQTAPLYKPQPVTKTEPNPAQHTPAKVAEPTPANAPTPTPEPPPPAKATPPPSLKTGPEARPDEIALFIRQPPKTTTRPEPPKLAATPLPTITPAPVQRPTASPLPTVAPEAKKVESIIATRLPSPSRPMPVQNPGYSPHREQRKIEGSSAPVGESGMDASGTARGRYIKGVNQIVGSRWTHYVHDQTQGSLIATGSVTIRFSLNEMGRIVRLQVTDNTSNAAHAALCERSIREAQSDLVPPPKELLRNGTFEDSFTFTLY